MNYLSVLRVLDTDYKIKDEEAARTNHAHKVEEIEGAAKEGHKHQASEIAGLSTVATSGSYSDLSGKPSAATESADGLMTSADKKKLDGIAAGAQANAVTGVKGGNESSYRTGNVNVTAAQVGAYTKYRVPARAAVKSYCRVCSMPANISQSQGGLAAIVMGASDFGGQEIPLIVLSFSTRGWSGSGDMPTNMVHATRIGGGTGIDRVSFITRLNGSTVELWMSCAEYTYNTYMAVFTDAMVTMLMDSNQTTAPTGTTVTYVPAAAYSTENKPTKSDVGLGNVDNTADSAKSVKYAATAGSATKLAAARTIALSGAVTGSAKFDGSGDVNISTTANESYISSPISGLYNMAVDADGNLWVYHSDSDKAPNFEYDPATGNLYYVTEA